MYGQIYFNPTYPFEFHMDMKLQFFTDKTHVDTTKTYVEINTYIFGSDCSYLENVFAHKIVVCSRVFLLKREVAALKQTSSWVITKAALANIIGKARCWHAHNVSHPHVFSKTHFLPRQVGYNLVCRTIRYSNHVAAFEWKNVIIYIKVLNKILSSTEKVTSNASGAFRTLQHRNLKDSDTLTDMFGRKHWKLCNLFGFPWRLRATPHAKPENNEGDRRRRYDISDIVYIFVTTRR